MMGHEFSDSRAPTPPDREAVMKVAMIRAAIRVARGIDDPDIAPMSEPFFGRWCDESQHLTAPSCNHEGMLNSSAPHIVACEIAMSDSEGGDHA